MASNSQLLLDAKQIAAAPRSCALAAHEAQELPSWGWKSMQGQVFAVQRLAKDLLKLLHACSSPGKPLPELLWHLLLRSCKQDSADLQGAVVAAATAAATGRLTSAISQAVLAAVSHMRPLRRWGSFCSRLLPPDAEGATAGLFEGLLDRWLLGTFAGMRLTLVRMRGRIGAEGAEPS